MTFELVLERTNMYLGAPASLESWWLTDWSSTLRLGVEQRRRLCAGDVDIPILRGEAP